MNVGRTIWCLWFGILACGCLPDNPTDELDLRPDPNEINARLRDMQLVRLDDGSTIEVSGQSSTTLSRRVQARCLDVVRGSAHAEPLESCRPKDFDYSIDRGQCDQEVCGAQLNLCAAALMLDVADTPVVFELDDVSIPAQSRATNAAIRERAVAYAHEAAIISGNALRTANGAPGATGDCGARDLIRFAGFSEDPSMDIQSAFEGAFAQGVQLSEQAVADATADNIAVAETLPAAFESVSVGRWAQWYGDTLSLTHAASLQVPLQASSRTFISDEAPCGSLGADLDLVLPDNIVAALRESGMRPDLLRDPRFDSDAIWTGAGLPEAGGMRERLAETTGDPTFATMPLSRFYALTGTGDAEMQLGRFRIGDQVEAMSPAPTQPFTPRLAAGVSTSFNYYAATYRPQIDRPEVQAAGLTAGLASLGLHLVATEEGSDGARPTMAYARTSQASFLDWAATVGSELTGLTDGSRPDIVLLASALSEVREGRVHVQYGVGPNGREMNFEVFGGYDSGDLLVVMGEADATCQTQGAVEGEVCAVSALPMGAPSVGGAPPDTGFTERLTFDVVVPGVRDETVFLLHRKGGTSGSGRGDYDILQAIAVDWAGALAGARDVVYPIVPAASFEAEQIVTMSAGACQKNEISCAGILRNATIPLENSLSEDGSEYENSWQHYLRIARIAADRADRLGQEWIDVGFMGDDRRERGWDDVETECGDVGDLANGVDAMASSGATCAGDRDCGVETGERCVGGTCLTTPSGLVEALGDEDSRARRLGDCLGIGQDDVIPFATLGSEPVCMWRNRATEVLCEDVEGAPDCPYARVARAESCSTPPPGSTLPDSAIYELIDVDDTLGISRNQYGRSEQSTGDIINTCNAIRRGWEDGGLPESVLAEHVRGNMSLLSVQQIASRIGWVAEPFNLSHLTVDGTGWGPRGVVDSDGRALAAGTGMLQNGSGGVGDAIASEYAWPCGGRPTGIDCAGGRSRSLFCQRVACSAAGGDENAAHERRASINDRLGRAVLALKMTTASPMGNFRSPFFPERPVAGYNVPSMATSMILGDVRVGGRVESLIWYSEIAQASTCSDVSCTGTRPYFGDGYCMPGCLGLGCPPIWSTYLNNGSWFHRTNVNCNETSSQAFMVFDPRRFADIDPVEGWVGRRAPEITTMMWTGIDGAPLAETDGGDRGDLANRAYVGNLFQRVLRRDDMRSSDVVIGRDSGHVEDLTLWWHRNDETSAAIAGHWNGQPASGAFARGLTVGNLNDALELVCEVRRSNASVCNPSAAPPEATAVRDLPAIQRHFQCVAAAIENSVDLAVLPNLPREAARGVGAGVGGSGFRIPQGQYGESILQYQAALEDLRSALPEVPRIIRAIGRDIERMEIVIRQMEISEQRRIIQIVSRAASDGARCASAIGQATGCDAVKGGLVTAVAECANTAAQIALGIADAALAGDSDRENLRSQMIDINQRMDDRMGVLNGISRQLREAVANLQTASVQLEGGRLSASRALARATLSDTTEGGRVLRTNTVLRRRYNTARTRYWRAFRDAQRLAYLARIAIEQQVGMDLGSVQEDMTLVDRPDTWADRICAATGIDYDRIRDFRDADYEDFADQYIGDYVTLLENFVESYRIDFPFQDGRDTMVISLRDDIHEVQLPCARPLNNLLLASGALDAEVVGTTGDPLWQPAGCEAPEPGEPSSCIARRRLSLGPEERPFADWHGNFDEVQAFEITFAPDDGTGTTLFTPESTVVQVTDDVAPGRYRLSWYGGDPGLETVLEVRGESLTASSVHAETTTTGWTRYHYLFDVPRGQPLSVHWVPLDSSATSAQSYVVAAPMLESLRDAVDAPSATGITPAMHPPPPYAETDEFGEHIVAACEDVDGRVFRATEWERRCQELCTDGFDRSCEAGITYCYYETDFTVEPEAIASGRFLRRAGFPRGSYNYRIETIGLNFPGTASRTCDNEVFEESCYANGSIPYSILHVGTHAVINHLGQDDYLAPIFPGRLEDARGLATERYITNPISSADRALMQDYMNRELRGRPVPGHYIVRVWDAPGVNFHGIEDVQVVLDYRYWTRQE